MQQQPAAISVSVQSQRRLIGAEPDGGWKQLQCWRGESKQTSGFVCLISASSSPHLSVLPPHSVTTLIHPFIVAPPLPHFLLGSSSHPIPPLALPPRLAPSCFFCLHNIFCFTSFLPLFSPPLFFPPTLSPLPSFPFLSSLPPRLSTSTLFFCM